MEDANNKLKEASENLEYAKNKNVEARNKSEEIRSQGSILANKLSQKILETAEIEIKRLQETTLMTIKFEEEKSLVEVVKKL